MKHVQCSTTEGFDSVSLGLEGASKMTVKLVSDDSVCIEIGPGGCSPDHAHGDKERMVVMSGSGKLRCEGVEQDIGPGDFVEFTENEQHQIVNNGTEQMVFMCFRNQQ